MNSIGFTGSLAPTAAQTRFMLRCAGDKPYLNRCRGGEWRCVGQHCFGYGKTWREAYNAWLIQSCIRSSFLGRRQA